ncbi:MAG: hypothetical protein IJ284_05575 [Clostridia bacterium]|nr:hypothetical protein [Clostridia bacterium]
MFKAKGKLISLLTACFAAVLSLVMAVATLTVQPKTASAAEGTWTLVTSAGDLAVGDQVIIVASDYDYALGTTQNTNNRGQASVTKSDNNTLTFTESAGVQVLTLEEGSASGYWAFNTGSGYLYSPSAKNYLKTQSNLNDNASWEIKISNDTTQIFNKKQTAYEIQKNKTSALFSCYKSTQCAVCLYKLVVSSGTTCDHVYDDGVETTPATCTTAGVKTFTCTVDGCGHSYTDTIDALGHNYVAGTPVNGIITYTCDRDGCGDTYEGYEGPWNLVTDLASLKAGDKVVIAASGYNYALSTNQKSNNRGQAAITKDTTNNTITWDGEEVQVLTLEAGTTAGTWAFNIGSGYLYAASSSNNYLRTETALSANSSWTISIATDGVATVTAQGTNTRNVMKYNNSSSLFACYLSTYTDAKDICLYELYTGEDSGESGGEVTVTDADKVAAELRALSFGVEVAADAEVALSTAGATYSEVSIAWNATNGTITDNKLAFTGVTTLTATATCGEESDTKSFTIYRGDSVLTIPQALALANALSGDSAYKYYVSGTVKNVVNTTYGNVYIEDAEGNEIYVYGLEDEAGNRYDAMETKPVATDVITVYAQVTYYAKNSLEELIEAKITAFTDNTPEVVEPEADSELTIPEAVELGNALQGDSQNNYYISGTVKEIVDTTYGNMYIEDEDGNTIYVYGTYDATGANRYDAMTNAPKVTDEVKLYSIVSYYGGAPQLKNAWIVDMVDNTFMAAQAAAKTEIAAYKNAEDYRDAEKAQINLILMEANAAIDACADETAVDAVVAEAKTKLDALKTNATYEAEEAAALAAAKENAKASLATYKNADDYRDAEKAEIASILESANTAIDACTSIDAVNAKVEEVKPELDALKTDADYKLEEAANLAEAQTNAKALLANYKNAANYRDAEKAEIEAILASAENAIDACESIEAVNAKVAAVKAELDAVKTNAQYEAEEAAALAQAKADAKAELAAYKNVDDYREFEQAKLASIVENAKMAIDACESIDAVNTKVAEVKVELDALKTNAQYEAEEAAALAQAKADAKAELAAYKNVEDYRDVEKTEIVSILATANTEIDACESIDAVNAKVVAVKADLDALKTDATYKAELAQAKKDAMAGLETYIKREDYRDAEILQRATILEIARVAINDCTSIEAVNTKVAEMKAKLDTLKTKAQYEVEEAAALAKAIEDGKAKLNKHFEEYDKGKYYPEEQAQLDACLAEYIKKMEEATSIDGAREVYEEFVRKMLEIEKIPSLSLDNLGDKDAEGAQSIIGKTKDKVMPYVPEQVKAVVGCSGVVGGVAGGVAALGIAVVALFKKKNGKDE